ncbi:ABC transporter ATP-binding protein [Martelella alba]|uniref:Sn-glycerol-3-phosphate ABC transporter ATP-binding protein UgpC n=1 Tax=Martelella alba TaxID=2590451 RepID=A0ABY2SHB2_9HYPH|nr:sn-glycerol-3-phosphate ABC transporter ATP-binding protein UgpC [Martelella alba]TKI04671.1 sn-glycerol-3-phosphate ABC transporter ATP-binding protein UgpC [Martelella alba]
MASLLIENVRKHYDKTCIINDISLNIADGEFLVLVGPSGCGKSTLLRMIAGLEDITDGTISIGGACVNALAPKDRNIAMVFQSYALYPHMTVYDNISFGLRLRNVAKDAIKEKVDNAAAILNLNPYLQRYPRELSGGQRQRVAMGRAIVREPDVFLFDEPLSNLDAQLRMQMRSEIKALQHRLETTTVYVTHDQVEAMTMADRIVVMRGGNIEQVGTPFELYDYPDNLFVAGFIGSPAMNFLQGRVQLRENSPWLVNDSGEALPLPPQADVRPDQRVTAGIRPNHLQTVAEGAQLTGKVAVVEPTGAETQILIDTSWGRVCMVVDTRKPMAEGMGVSLLLGAEHIRVFDTQTGRSLMPNARRH